jgi:hypothetical protein
MTTEFDDLDERTGSRALIPLRAAAILALAAGTATLASAGSRSLPGAVASTGVLLDPGSIRWLDGPGFGARRVMFLAQGPDGAPDVHVATVRTAPDDRVLRLEGVANLTRSPDAAESLLCATARWAAFASRVGDAIVAVTVVDLRGAPDAGPALSGERLREAVSQWQQTGRPQGYGFDRYELLRPASRVRLALEGDALRVDADGESLRIDAASRRVVEGASRVRHQQRLAGTTGWVTWLVDTVRGVPWIGPTPIAWLEHVAFGLQHEVARARVSIGADRSRDEVAEDLADVLQGDHSARAEGRVEGWPPARMSPMLPGALPREGEWIASASDDPFVAQNPGAPPAFYQSFVRTDRERPDTRVYVTLWDPRQVSLHVVPGSQEPMGATGETGTGTIPRDDATMLRLAAGFNGGFQALHGEWGVFAEGTLFLPPKPWGATIAVLEDGRTGFGSWPGQGTQIPAEVSEFRQNLTSLVEDGVFNPYRRTFWGGNVPGAPPGESHTARTGLCMTRESAVAFFWGRGLTERSLADAMLAARCTYGVHLDMNGANTGFEFLRVTRAAETPPLRRRIVTDHESEGPVPSAPRFTYRARRMVRGMDEMGFPRYIKRDPRDYFYLMLRAVLPGAPLRTVVQPALPGEGRWQVSGLGDAPFPWPMARTRVRPDGSQPERWVNVVRVDPGRVRWSAADGTPALAQVVEAPGAPPSTHAITWRDGRWVVVEGTEGVAGQRLGEGVAATRGACVDRDGWLVYAVADRAAGGLIARAMDLAGCGADRLALPVTTALALNPTRDVAGAAVDPRAAPRFALRLRDNAGAVRVFPEVLPVPQRVWWDAQHRRVRYQRDETGAVQVNTVGGRVSVPSWGGSRHPSPATPAP